MVCLLLVVVGDARLAPSGWAATCESVCQEAGARWRGSTQLRLPQSLAQTRHWPSLSTAVLHRRHITQLQLHTDKQSAKHRLPSRPSSIQYRTDVDFACHLVEARSSETFGAGSTGVNPQSQHTSLLWRLQWQLPYHPSATPSMTSHCPRVTKPCFGICPARFHVPTVVSRAPRSVCLLLHGPHRLRLQADALRRRSMCCLHPSDKSQLPPAGVFG